MSAHPFVGTGAPAASAEAAFYRRSGKISFLAIAVGMAVAGLLVLVVPPLYALILVYNPSLYLGVLLPFVFAGALGGTISFAMSKLGDRSSWASPVLAFGTAVVGYLVSWPFWMYITMRRMEQPIEPLSLLWPPFFLDLLGAIYQEGVWTVGNNSTSAVSGVMLGTVWAIEALIVILGTPAIAAMVGKSGVFCESCQRWTKKHDSVLRYTPEHETELSTRLKVRDLGALGQAGRVELGRQSWAALSVHACEGCGGTNTLLLERVALVPDKRGQAQEKRVAVVEHLLVSKDEADWVRRLSS